MQHDWFMNHLRSNDKNLLEFPFKPLNVECGLIFGITHILHRHQTKLSVACLHRVNYRLYCGLRTKRALKPMDSLVSGENQWNYFSSLNHNFIVLCELLIPCQLFAQKCWNSQEITKISKCLGSPKHSAIGNMHWDILLLGIITLQHVIQNDCRSV